MRIRILVLLLLVFILNVSLWGQKKVEISIPSINATNLLSPMIYGNFIEFLGSCINGGIYDEKSYLSDDKGFRKDVLEKVKEMRIAILRYPGGTVSKIILYC